MNDLGLAMFAYLARSTAVGLMAMLLVARLSRRRGPEAGAMAASAGLTALVLTAGLSLAPWPQGWILRYPARSDPSHAALAPPFRRFPVLKVGQAVTAGREIVSSEPNSGRTIGGRHESSSKSFQAVPSLTSASEQASLPSAAEASEKETILGKSAVPRALSAWPAWLLCALSAGWTLGVVRLALGLRELRRRVAKSFVIDDAELLRVASELSAALGYPQTVVIREWSAHGLPATVEFIKPCILLPRSWREWTEAECRVVLAHELAHIRRRDFAKRLAGQLCVIVHFYHPIAHWLMARLRLQQELAADCWGIRLAGGRTRYLTTLARIALRHDASLALGFDRSLLAFDGLFLRRIDMLYRNEALGRAVKPTSTRARWMTFGLLASAAILATAVRAPLAPADDHQPPTSNDPAALSQRNTEVPLDLSLVPAEAVGVVAFRPSSLVGNEEIQPLVTMARTSDALKDWFEQAAKIGLTPESIDQVIYVQLKTDVETALKDELSVLRRGALIIKTNAPYDVKGVADAIKELMGKYGLELSLSDGIVIVGDAAVVKQICKHEKGGAAKQRWSEAWSAVERSQVAVAFDAESVRKMTDPFLMNSELLELMLFAAPAAPIWDGAKSISMGMNVVGEQVEILSLNVAGTAQAAETTYQTDQALLTLARNAAGSITRHMRKFAMVDSTAWEFLMIAKFADLYTSQILQHTRIERTGNAVRFSTKIDLDTLLMLTWLR
jgi:BlaR1 peptidase M56